MTCSCEKKSESPCGQNMPPIAEKKPLFKWTNINNLDSDRYIDLHSNPFLSNISNYFHDKNVDVEISSGSGSDGKLYLQISGNLTEDDFNNMPLTHNLSKSKKSNFTLEHLEINVPDNNKSIKLPKSVSTIIVQSANVRRTRTIKKQVKQNPKLFDDSNLQNSINFNSSQLLDGNIGDLIDKHLDVFGGFSPISTKLSVGLPKTITKIGFASQPEQMMGGSLGCGSCTVTFGLINISCGKCVSSGWSSCHCEKK